jgi:hypothetical protein
MLSSSPNSTPINITLKDNYQFIDLRPSIRLRSLHLNIEWADDRAAERVACVLSRIISMHLDAVSFTILRQMHDQFDAFNWGTIDEALA